MASSRRSCRNKPDVFYYICGKYTLVQNRKPITSSIKRSYHAYFQMALGDQDKDWAPHIVCKKCTEYLRVWSKGQKTALKFGIPMVWREPTDHVTDCYFCAVNVSGINIKNQSSLIYPNLLSARRPVAHSDDIPVPAFKELPDIDEQESPMMSVSDDEEDYVVQESGAHESFTQMELNDLVRDLNLSKSSAELLASRLKKKTVSPREFASPTTATNIKTTYNISVRRRTWRNVMILHAFYTSSEWQNTTPNIGGCSSTATSAH